jgi:hypothetical protein
MYSPINSKVLTPSPPNQVRAYIQLYRTIMWPRNSVRQLLWCFQSADNCNVEQLLNADISCPAHQLAVFSKQKYTAHGSKECPTPKLYAVTRCG